MDGGSHGGSELTGGSFLASAMMKKGKIKLTVDSEELLALFKNSTLEVKEGTQMSITDKDGNNELQISVPSERRILQLKFLDEVSPTVLAGGGFHGKDDAAIRLAIVDKTTDKIVDAGPEASAKVEILILQANHDENEHNWTIEDFNRRIIIGSDKGKPYISKNVYVYLKGGEGSLCNIKLGHGCTWLKDCLCRLGARVVDNFSMSTVKEAWTNAFMVRDRRIKYNQKKKTPSLSDKICTLRNIQKGGKTEQSLKQEQIHTVEDLLIRLLKDPDGLKRIYLDSGRLGEKRWDDMVKNARSCLSGQRMYFCRNSLLNIGVCSNIHGEAQGFSSDNQLATAQMFSEKDKVDASKLLSYAKGHWGDVEHFDDDIVSNMEYTQDCGLEHSDYILENPFAGPHHIFENSVDVMNVEAGTNRRAAGQAIGSHNTVNHAGSSSQGFVSIRASTQDIGLLEDPSFGISDVPILCGMSVVGNRSPQRLKMLCVVLSAAIRFQVLRDASFLKRATSNEGGARKKQKVC